MKTCLLSRCTCASHTIKMEFESASYLNGRIAILSPIEHGYLESRQLITWPKLIYNRTTSIT